MATESVVLKFPRMFVGSVLLLAVLMVLGLLVLPAEAAGVRRGVQAQNGEFVLIRTVPARHAVRTQPPGMAVLVSANVQPETQQMLGGSELDDADFSAITAAVPGRSARGAVGGALQGAGLLGLGAGRGPAGGTGVPAAGPGGVLGNIHGATRNLGGQITGALQGAGLLKGGG